MKKAIDVETIQKLLQKYLDENNNIKLSVYIVENTKLNYTYVSNLYTEKTGETITDFLIKLRIQKVKVLMEQDITLTEIADIVGYCSLQHLSYQFKKMCRISPSEYIKRLVKPII